MSRDYTRQPTPVHTFSQREVSDLINSSTSMLAAVYRHRKEIVRMQESLKQAIDEKTLDMLTELDLLRSRIEAIQVSLAKIVPPPQE